MTKKNFSKYTKEEMELLLHSAPYKVKTKVAGKPINFTFEGIVTKFNNKYIVRDVKTMSERTQKTVELL